MPVCDILEFEQESTEFAKYSLVVHFLGSTITIKSDQIPGSTLKFPITPLNENFEYTGQVFNESGVLVPIVVGEETYDCIKFKTKVNVEFVYT